MTVQHCSAVGPSLLQRASKDQKGLQQLSDCCDACCLSGLGGTVDTDG